MIEENFRVVREVVEKIEGYFLSKLQQLASEELEFQFETVIQI